MHSIKNTIIAVGLLGLSFWFYTESKRPDLSGEVPALNVSDGTGIGEMASNGLDAVKSKFGQLKSLEIPDLSAQKQKAADFATDMSNQLSQKAGQLKDQASQLKNEFKSQVNDLANDFSIPTMPQLQAPQVSNPNFDQSNSPIVNRQPLELDSSARDEGLINALQEQTNWAKNAPANSTDNGFSANSFNANSFNANSFNAQPSPKVSGSQSPADDEFSFASQPVSSNNSSYNSLASNTSVNSGTNDGNVFRAGSAPDASGLSLQAVWPEVDRLVERKKFRDALALLSRYYRDANLSGPQRQRLYGWLDALAGKVIFSSEDHLAPGPYTVGNETLADISRRWQVPAQVIYNVNKSKIDNPLAIPSGTELKIIEGPFFAEVSMNNKVMTLFLGDLYAGRFPVEVGISGSPSPGTFQVLAKSETGHAWMDSNGTEYPPESPNNGYGPNWIGLSRSLCIHQISDSTSAQHDGCIGLKGRDAKDVFGILGRNSTVTLMR